MSSYRSFLLCGLMLVAGYMASAQHPITLQSLLTEMTDPDGVTRFPDPAYSLKQSSSYDRASISPDQPGWFANADFNQFIREEKKEGHNEFVMMDADGPGAIVRFWLTSLVKSGTLRIYFDHQQDASLQIPAYDLMKAGLGLGTNLLIPHSSYDPQGKGGSTLYLPLPYQKHCKVTFEFADSVNQQTPHYYQINYRTYAPGAVVKTFTLKQLERYRTSIDRTDSLLGRPPVSPGLSIDVKKQMKPGSELVIPIPWDGSAIRTLKMELTTLRKEDQEALWRWVILRIRFDDRETVVCPLGDFIGSGFGGRKIHSWYRDLSDSGILTSRWIMPYKQLAVITLQNQNQFPVSIHVDVRVAPFQWTAHTMYFHANNKFEVNVRDAKWDYDLMKVAKKDSMAPIDWNFIRIPGKGIYMGNTLSVENHMKSWYGEGDAKAYVDGETFPSEFGTGLEDYYNTSWAPVVLYQTPFANAPRADSTSSEGFNTFTRTRILDAIPFTKSFSFDMEMLSWDGGTIDASATTYWYGF